MNNIKKRQNSVFVHKDPYINLPYEICMENILYAFTINPMDQHEIRTNRLELVKRDTNLFLDKLESVSWWLETEISSLGRIHFHGYLIIKNKQRHYLMNINKLMKECTFCIKAIDDLPVWEAYIHKQMFSDPICNCEATYMFSKKEELEILLEDLAPETDTE